MVDTSTEAVTNLLDGVTPGPWIAESGHVQQNGKLYWQVTDKNDAIMQNQFCWCQGDHAANARFIAAARDLVPALLAERDAARAEVERLKAQPVTVQDAVKVPEVQALIDDASVRCGKCGHPRNNHHFRHPFVSAAVDVANAIRNRTIAEGEA